MTGTSPAAKGAALLDNAYPGWAGKINIETLDLSGARMCVLGQLYGSSEAGCKALGQDNHRAFRPHTASKRRPLVAIWKIHDGSLTNGRR